MTSDSDPGLLIYRQTCDHHLVDPRPGPRHTLRAELHPSKPSDLCPSRKEPTVVFEPDRDDGPAPATFQDYDPVLDGGAHHRGHDLLAGGPAAPGELVDIAALDAPALELVACRTCGSGVHPDRIRS